ncbi:hypothetical protein SSAG_04915 [Streptomyces sp. Mg1]|nr:hypothetical protein SSAG_04915 [Streptomyces sp. Mg1]
MGEVTAFSDVILGSALGFSGAVCCKWVVALNGE